MGKKPKILVVGSFVMDLIVSAERFPSAGETVIGCGFSTAPGGKGANQAIQAARLGAEVVMAGKVGKDDFGKRLLDSARKSGVNTDLVVETTDFPSAVGNVQLQVTQKGTQNRIIVVPGANMQITADDISTLENRMSEFNMVILQNEIPMKINEIVAGYAKKSGVPIMLNPAPSAKIPEELISALTYISPNEHEVYDITGIKPDKHKDILKAVHALNSLGVQGVIITLGKNGAAYCKDGSEIISPSIDCGPVVDPTAAGDSFIGAFCTAIAAGIPAQNALEFANCTAGITVSRMGAQTSLPCLDEVITVMKNKKYDTLPFTVLEQGAER